MRPRDQGSPGHRTWALVRAQVWLAGGLRTFSRGLERPPRSGEHTRVEREDCIATDELVAMIEGTLGRDRVDAVVAHVDGCSTCTEVIASLGAFEEDSRRVGRYQLERPVGSGGMGIVYAAWDPELERRVAVKLVRPERADDAARARMLREARALARIAHPNVVAVHDAGVHDGDVYVATELVDGETLATWPAGRGNAEIAGAWIQVARGLAAAHAQGVVHRDVKPANALVGRDGRVRIGDFGLARHFMGENDARQAEPPEPAASPWITAAGAVAGTPAYMAPEQRTGSVDARSDQFALCVSLAEALTGRRPEADAEVSVEPPELAAALRRGLRGDPAARFPDVGALADALSAAIAPPSRLRRTALLGGAIGAILTGSLVAWFASGAGGEACEVATVPADLWSAERRARMDAALPGPIGRRVDAWVASWTAASAGVCTNERAAPELRDRRQSCLDRALDHLRQQLARWEEAPPADALLMHASLDDLPAVSRCSRAAVSAVAEPTAEQAARIEPLRARMEKVQTEAEAAQVVEQARQVGHAPFTVHAMRVLAERQKQSDVAASLRTLRSAIAIAEAAGDDFSRVRATIDLVSRLGAAESSDAEKLAETARARIAALGGDPGLEAELDFQLGTVWAASNRHDEAIAAFERARRGFRAAHGAEPPHEAVVLVALGGVYFDRDPDPARGRALVDESFAIFRRAGIDMPEAAPRDSAALIEQTKKLLAIATAAGSNTEAVVDATYNLAIAYALAEQPELALKHYQDAAALGARLGLRDAKLANALGQSAAILLELGRPREALPVARSAVAMSEKLSADVELGTALTMLGDALLETGQAAAAREPLRRSLAIRDRLQESARFRGHTRFLLARSMWGANRKRARGLAQAARVDLEAYLEGLAPADPNTPYLRRQVEGRLTKIDRWLATHR